MIKTDTEQPILFTFKFCLTKTGLNPLVWLSITYNKQKWQYANIKNCWISLCLHDSTTWCNTVHYVLQCTMCNTHYVLQHTLCVAAHSVCCSTHYVLQHVVESCSFLYLNFSNLSPDISLVIIFSYNEVIIVIYSQKGQKLWWKKWPEMHRKDCHYWTGQPRFLAVFSCAESHMCWDETC